MYLKAAGQEPVQLLSELPKQLLWCPSGPGSPGQKRSLLPVQRSFISYHVCNHDLQPSVSASTLLHRGFNNDYFAKLRSHNGQLISNETVT